jgi:hypothetical protein
MPLTTESLALWQQRYGLVMLLLERGCRVLAKTTPAVAGRRRALVQQAASRLSAARKMLMTIDPRDLDWRVPPKDTREPGPCGPPRL